MKVNVEDIIKMMQFKRSINRVKLEDIEWYLDGKKQIISSDEVEEFGLIGLNNTDFISYFFSDTVEAAGLDGLNISIIAGYKEELK